MPLLLQDKGEKSVQTENINKDISSEKDRFIMCAMNGVAQNHSQEVVTKIRASPKQISNNLVQVDIPHRYDFKLADHA